MANLSFLTSAVNSTAQTTYTFSSQSLGTADPFRYIIVNVTGASASAGRTISTVTVGGISGNILVQDAPGASSRVSGIAIAAVPTGTTGDVVVTFSTGGVDRAGIGLYRATGISATPYHTNSNDTTSAASLSTTINTISGGVLIACFEDSTTSVASVGWTGATENYDQLLATNHLQSGAYTTSTSTATGATVTATPNISITTGASISVASFQSVEVRKSLALLGVGL